MSGDSPFLDRSWREFSSRLYGPSREGLEFGLDRIQRALELEGRPDRSSPSILVAGTNGKGGTAAFLSGILQSHGYRVGLFTSPHLVGLRERFRVDGQPVSRERVRRVGAPVVRSYGSADGEGGSGRDGERTGEPELSFFELTTLMAASVFEDCSVDVAIYEVGMGGRLDATNAIDPALSVITAIDRDHEMFLGETIASIAEEKCGILRSGVPAVVGFQPHAEGRRTIETHRRGEPTRYAGDDFDVDAADVSLKIGAAELQPFDETAATAVTLGNAATAAEAARVFLEGAFDGSEAVEGLRRTSWPGRNDRRVVEPEQFDAPRAVELWLDAAHNPGAVQELLDAVTSSEFVPGGVIVGGMSDKKLEAMFRRLSGGPPVWGAELEGSRSARGAGLKSLIPDDVRRGVGPLPSVLSAAVRDVAGSDPDAGLLIFGSSYLIGASFEALGFGVDDLGTFE